MGELSEALSILDTSSRSRAIVDRTIILETRGVFFLAFQERAGSSKFSASPDTFKTKISGSRRSMAGPDRTQLR
jgi:hypothetical protein